MDTLNQNVARHLLLMPAEAEKGYVSALQSFCLRFIRNGKCVFLLTEHSESVLKRLIESEVEIMSCQLQRFLLAFESDLKGVPKLLAKLKDGEFLSDLVIIDLCPYIEAVRKSSPTLNAGSLLMRRIARVTACLCWHVDRLQKLKALQQVNKVKSVQQVPTAIDSAPASKLKKDTFLNDSSFLQPCSLNNNNSLPSCSGQSSAMAYPLATHEESQILQTAEPQLVDVVVIMPDNPKPLSKDQRDTLFRLYCFKQKTYSEAFALEQIIFEKRETHLEHLHPSDE